MLSVLTWGGLFESTNPAWQAGLGWSKQELVGAPYANLVHPDDLSESLAVFAQLQGGQQVLRFENRYRDKSGNYRWLSWVIVPEAGRFYCSARDITEQKAQAAALSQAGEQLRQAQKMEAVGQLTGGIAHDFNNLLTGVTGSLELIERRCATGQLDVESVLRLTSVAKGAAKRAAALTHRLLAFSRRQTLAPDPTDVDHLVAGMQDLIQRTVGPAITMRFVPQAEPWTVLVDKNQLENALLNLCINARDAMPNGGTLEIASRNMQLDERHALRLALAPGDYLRLAVADTGVGMTPEVMQRAFDPFFTTKPLGEGTGLGLSMIYGFARQSGGQARLKSELGRGTQVSIYLPRHGGPALALDAAAPQQRAGAAADGETILLVDDEATVRLFVAEVLGDSGYQVLEAADAAQGLEILRSNSPIALLVTDVGLPGGTNGRQLADAARVLRPGLQVLFITGYAESALWQAGSLPGGMEVLVKPFDMDDLSERVEHLMAPQRALH